MNEKRLFEIIGRLYVQAISSEDAAASLKSQNEQLSKLLSQRNTSTLPQQQERGIESNGS